MKIGVLGASGYAGGELLRLLSGHPDFKVSYIAAGSNAGEKITDLHSHLVIYGDQRFAGTDIDAINKCDLIFLALPHGQSAEIVKQIIFKGCKPWMLRHRYSTGSRSCRAGRWSRCR